MYIIQLESESFARFILSNQCLLWFLLARGHPLCVAFLLARWEHMMIMLLSERTTRV